MWEIGMLFSHAAQNIVKSLNKTIKFLLARKARTHIFQKNDQVISEALEADSSDSCCIISNNFNNHAQLSQHSWFIFSCLLREQREKEIVCASGQHQNSPRRIYFLFHEHTTAAKQSVGNAIITQSESLPAPPSHNTPALTIVDSILCITIQ